MKLQQTNFLGTQCNVCNNADTIPRECMDAFVLWGLQGQRLLFIDRKNALQSVLLKIDTKSIGEW